MDINIVDILNTGVTGFAFLMLFLGYKLTSDVQSKIFEKRADEFPSVEMYKEWKSLVTSQLNNTRYFLVFSLIFFAGGLFLLLYQAESKIILAITPLDHAYAPLVHHQSETLKLSDTGRATLSVKDEHNISISYEKLLNRIQELTFTLEDQKLVTKDLVLINANNATDSGF
ncbi:hypothetical protein DV711_11130 [Motiliproteus coralliicola]|uniref:Uncharacterized protein n=1 Tax=Motiliproteus coralliicola TaxID=2283196 RepID=A0A369WBQ5_9GAMM|nr:hypothetical protein [Motiliproteus coralliicola]RDE19440.1 hypothetical protein DV711_11130 [Motiliproteus coralliicola]